MPARVLVYCKKPVEHLTVESLVEELHGADLMTLAESLNLSEGEEEAVEEMWEKFHVEPGKGPIDGIEIFWHARQRPIQVRQGPPLAGEIEETLDDLPEEDSPGAQRVRKHLRATREVVEFEMGIDGSHHLAATISEVLAFFVAAQGDGIVWFYHREFASPKDRGATLWKTSE